MRADDSRSEVRGKRKRIWICVASTLIFLGWGVPLAFLALDRWADHRGLVAMQENLRWLANSISQAISFNHQIPWLLWMVPMLGLIGFLMIAAASPVVRRWHSYRFGFILIGCVTVALIAMVALAVDSQPPGSGLAMLVSMFGVCMGPFLIGGIAIGLVGLLMCSPWY